MKMMNKNNEETSITLANPQKGEAKVMELKGGPRNAGSFLA